MTDDTALVDMAATLLPAPSGPLSIRNATVTAVNRGTNVYTVTMGGTTGFQFPAYENVYASVGDVVEVLFVGSAPRILGVVGLAQGLPDTSTFCNVSTATTQTIPSAAWTRVTGMACTEGNAALWDATNQWYTVPSTGLYQLTARVRVADFQTAGINFAWAVDVGDTPSEYRTVWNMIPAGGGNKRVHSVFALTEQLTAGQQWRAAMYFDGASTVIANRNISIVKLGT